MSQPTQQGIPDTRNGWGQIPFALIADLAPLHGNILKIVYFVARHTFGWHVRSVLISYDDFINGIQIRAGRLQDKSGLTHPETVKRAIEQAIAAGMLEREETPQGFIYRIPERYWKEANVKPSTEFWSYYYTEQTTHKKRVDTPETSQTTHNLRGVALTKSERVYTQNVSNPPHKMLTDETPQIAPEAPPEEEPIHTSTDTVIHTLIDTSLVQKEEEQEEVRLRNDYARLSHELAQLDPKKQTGQWTRLFKQVQAAKQALDAYRATLDSAPRSEELPPAPMAELQQAISKIKGAIAIEEANLADVRREQQDAHERIQQTSLRIEARNIERSLERRQQELAELQRQLDTDHA